VREGRRADPDKHRINSPEADPEAVALWQDMKFRMFACAVTGAYSGILIRCIYRYGFPRGVYGMMTILT
jgi:hypothetical protein